MQEIFPSHKKEKKITSPKDISEEKTPHYGTFGRSQFEPKEENIDKLSTDPTIPHRGSDLRARSFHRDEDEGEKETGGMFVAIATKEDRKPRRTGTFGQEIHDDVDKLD